MPAPLLPIEQEQEPLRRYSGAQSLGPGALVGMALGLVLVFGIARWLDPYDHGRPWRMETHMQSGLPPCNFRMLTGMPCPSCGMTTAWPLLVRGDVANLLRANAVGTLLALFCLAVIPWSLLSAIRGRSLFLVSLERTVTWIVIVFLALMLIRWIIVIGLGWWKGTGF